MTGSLSTCIYVTALVLLLVAVMPAIDLYVCRKLKLNLMGGPSPNSASETFMKLRKAVIFLVFLIYLGGLMYIPFFSRSATEDYQIHIALFEDLKKAIYIDFGLFGAIYDVLTGSSADIASHIRITNQSDIAQVYLNIMLFIPLGYLLPYMSEWYRRKVTVRTTLTAFLVSLAVENLQLITKHGFYDLDDLVTNTLGGYIGGLLYLAFAFRLTHPDWKAELKRYRRWKKNARTRTLYPFARKVDLSRTVLLGTDETAVWDFYVKKLGFRVVRQLVPEDSPDTSFLLELGTSQVEIRCSNREEDLPEQFLVITSGNIEKVKRRVEENGIETGPMEADPFTGMSRFSFRAPDNVTVSVINA